MSAQSEARASSAGVAIVTGGASGIGRATVELLLRRGWRVLAVDLNADAGHALADELAVGDRLDFVQADVSDEAHVAGAIERASSRFGGLDCMVNNAGVGGAFGPLTEIEVEDWDYTFAVLVRGVFLGIKHAARAMRGRGGGSIVNTASPAGLAAGLGPQAYSAAKAAVISLTRVAAVELAADRIRVNAVNPGVVLTPLLGDPSKVAPGTAFRDALPWPDYGTPEDVAAVIAFLAGQDAGYVTGETINVDGGLMASGPLGGPKNRAGGPTSVVGVNRGTTGAGATVRRDLRR
jgi:NAD(P)-dependent dehydrogenase (short-subunit alcohol dehydrogenase family)